MLNDPYVDHLWQETVAEHKRRRVLAVQQLPEYRNKRGLFAREGVHVLAKTMQSADWWAMHGLLVPEL